MWHFNQFMFCFLFHFCTDSSIKSTSEANFFSLQNETVSDTLLDKFNNITTNNTISDRIITRVTIRKDSRHRMPSSMMNGSDNKSKLTQYQPRQVGHQQIKYATMNTRNTVRNCGKELLCSKSQESILTKNAWQQLGVRRDKTINQFDNNKNKSDKVDGNGSVDHQCNGLTLGISIIQGSDNNVYVKDLVNDGPGARSGIQIGDQVSVVGLTRI